MEESNQAIQSRKREAGGRARRRGVERRDGSIFYGGLARVRRGRRRERRGESSGAKNQPGVWGDSQISDRRSGGWARVPVMKESIWDGRRRSVCAYMYMAARWAGVGSRRVGRWEKEERLSFASIV